MPRNLLTTFLLLFAPGLLLEQLRWSSNSGIKAQSISVKVLGPPAWPLGLSYGQMLNERLSLELGIGLLSCGAGFDYYLTNPRERRSFNRSYSCVPFVRMVDHIYGRGFRKFISFSIHFNYVKLSLY